MRYDPPTEIAPVEPAPAAPSRLGGGKVVVFVLVGLGALLIFGGIAAALAIYGVRKYIRNAKLAEGEHSVAALASGVLRCAASTGTDGKPRGLPATALPVPANFAEVAGRKYQSNASDWADPAYTCAGFRLGDPQYFQYQWARQSPSAGKVVALADLDGDGAADARFEQAVVCDAGRCSAGQLARTAH